MQNKKLADLNKDSGPGTGALKGKAKKQACVHAAIQHTRRYCTAASLPAVAPKTVCLCPTSRSSPLWHIIRLFAIQERIENSMKMETGRLFATMKMQQVGLVSVCRAFMDPRPCINSRDVCGVDASQPKQSKAFTLVANAEPGSNIWGVSVAWLLVSTRPPGCDRMPSAFPLCIQAD